MKIKGLKGMKLLGFVDETCLDRGMAMAGVECVLPSKNASMQNLRAFNSIVKAMILLEKAAIARYVKKQNDAPKLVALYP